MKYSIIIYNPKFTERARHLWQNMTRMKFFYGNALNNNNWWAVTSTNSVRLIKLSQTSTAKHYYVSIKIDGSYQDSPKAQLDHQERQARLEVALAWDFSGFVMSRLNRIEIRSVGLTVRELLKIKYFVSLITQVDLSHLMSILTKKSTALWVLSHRLI